MCGIVGIIGKTPVAPRLVEGLRRLEYRGYDSAGIATLVDGDIERRRAAGKLSSLTDLLGREPVGGTLGIGHTRWATHGKPTESNAHPHAAPEVAVVHNGIIENFRELRAELTAAGHVFTSETDTETIAHLVADLHIFEGTIPDPIVTRQDGIRIDMNQIADGCIGRLILKITIRHLIGTPMQIDVFLRGIPIEIELRQLIAASGNIDRNS